MAIPQAGPEGTETRTCIKEQGVLHIVKAELEGIALTFHGYAALSLHQSAGLHSLESPRVMDVQCVYLWEDADDPGFLARVQARLCEIGYRGRICALAVQDSEGLLWRMDRAAFRATIDLHMEAATELQAAFSEELYTIRLDRVQERHIEWLWAGRLARGKMSMLDGDGGVGKTLLYNTIAARITRGEALPDGVVPEQGNVLFLCPEDDVADMVKPRMLQAGADVTRVYVLNDLISRTKEGQEEERTVSLPRDIPLLECIVREREIVLLVIDPIMSMISLSIDAHKDQAIRSVLTPLARLAENTRCSILLVRHLNKGENHSLLYRGGGSIAFTSACRTALMVIPDADHTGRYVLTRYKGNIGKKPADLAYRIESAPENENRPALIWEGESYQHIEHVLKGNPYGDRTKKVLDLLEAHQDEHTPQEIACILQDIPLAQIRVYLSHLKAKGMITTRSRGKYCSLTYAQAMKDVLPKQ